MIDYTVDDLAALAAAIYGEARSESRKGQDAVAHVAINRARGADVSVADVVYGSADPQDGQFSFANPGIYGTTVGNAPARDPDGWAKAVAVAEDALEGRTKDPTGGASHYFNPGYNSRRSDRWAAQMEDLGAIGNHHFYRESDGGAGITRVSAEHSSRRQPGVGHMQPGIFGYHILSALDDYRGPVIPVPTGRGVTAKEFAIDEFANNTEPPWSSQFAPGGTGLLGADPIAPPDPLEYFGPPPPRLDYPTGPTDPAPWVGDFASAPAYPPRMASRERFEKTFARPDPHAPVLQPGMSDRARAVAMRDLADTMAQASIAGLDGRRMAAQSAVDEGPGLGSVESGMPSAPHTYDPGTLHRVPVPKARPGGYRPMPAPVPRRRPVAPGGVVPVPTARPEPMGWPTPSSIPVPRPAPRRGAGLAPLHDAIAPLGSYASGPKKQIFDFVLGKLLKPTPRPT